MSVREKRRSDREARVSDRERRGSDREGIDIEVGGHATVLVRARGFTLLCDPHLRDGYRAGLTGFAPARRILPDALPRPDAVWISHSHRDHFDIASLDLLDRALPVLHPDDPRIEHALRRLGFTDTTVVHDWMSLTPRPGLDLVWTPSTLAVPEHGLAIRTAGSLVWHMVDSLVTPAWVDRLLAAGPQPLALLLTPCQPIMETRSVEGVPPGADADWAEPLSALLERSRPAHVVPLPEGQFGLDDAAWLNGHKFPVSPDLVDRALRTDDPGRRILRPAPGDRITVTDAGTVRLEEGATAWARATGETRDRGYRPGHWIAPLTDARTPPSAEAHTPPLTVAGTLHFADAGTPPSGDALDRLLAAPARDVLSHLAATAAGRLRETCYRFTVVGPGSAPAAARTVRLLPDGILAPAPPESVADVEVAVTAGDLEDLLAGDLGYSAAQYGGRLREIRAADPGPAVITSRHDPVPDSGAVMLSGIGLFALLLRASLGSALVELDREIDACHQRRPRPVARVHPPLPELRPPLPELRPPPPALRPLPARPSSLPSRRPPLAGLRSLRPARRSPGLDRWAQDAPELGEVWASIGRCLARGDDPGGASGTIAGGGYAGVLGRTEWPVPRDDPAGGTGSLLLSCLVEAQPHLGGGVRFPHASYRRLLANLEASPIRRWRVITALPEGLGVPAWRSASLFPVTVDRLRTDLARRGWRGEIVGPGPAEPRWWLGVPPLPGRVGAGPRVLRVTESPGCRLRGEVGPRTPDGEGPDFLLWSPSPGKDVLTTLVRGDVRFSWLLPPRETAARAGRPVDPVAFAERVALLATAEFLREHARTELVET
ncbi:MBL fold metallo-hydrolase [Actinomadura sp. 9N215]|uniref:MBL fold metallo-hydrolase n=1 Tax=Actinomadura sp. 9N215 TaxID=3375150 RepID=UPI00378883DA